MVACSWSSASPRPGETFTFLRYGARSSMRSRSGVSAYRSSTSIDGLTCVSESITRNPRFIDSRGGPRHGPPHPPTLGAPRGTCGAPRPRASAGSSDHVGGPDMAPHTPQRSGRPGEPVALLDLALLWAHLHVGGPDMAPHTPQRSERPGEPVALLDLTLLWAHLHVGGPDMAPHTP